LAKQLLLVVAGNSMSFLYMTASSTTISMHTETDETIDGFKLKQPK